MTVTPLSALDDSRAGVIARMDNFTIAVLISAVPFALLLIYGFWSGILRLGGEPPSEHRRDGEDTPGQSA